MIDLRSDTVTKPTDLMREAIYSAKVGDDVYGDDDTVKELESKLANMLGKEAGLFVPSGTFSNQLAILTHTNRGDEVIALDNSHIVEHEVGAAALLSAVTVRTAKNDMGEYDLDHLSSLIRSDNIHYPRTSLICLENAHSNGRAIPVSHMKEVYDIAKSNHLPIHLDGARIFNAAISLDVEAKELAKYADSVSVCISKGLSAPIGSVLVGSTEFIKKARKYRKLMGGAMRQVGIIASAGIVALNHMIDRLEDDHLNADYLGVCLDEFEHISVYWDRLDINMVFFKVHMDIELVDELLKRDIIINPKEEDGTYRFVTHSGITKRDIDKVIIAMKEIINNGN